MVNDAWNLVDVVDAGRDPLIAILFIAGLMVLAYGFTRVLLRRVFLGGLRRAQLALWSEVIERRRLFRLAGILAAAIAFHVGTQFFGLEGRLESPEEATIFRIIDNIFFALVFVLVLLTIDRALACISDIYGKSRLARERPIKGYIQFTRIILIIVGIIVGGTLALGESPWAVLTGIGAASAVILLIFRDTLLSLVAGLQLASNDLVHIGDWIEMPQYGADGDVIDIALHTVKVQNFDKTIVSIPTHKLVEGGFKNWRGMSDFGGRRFKRAIVIDGRSVKFCKRDFLRSLSHVDLIHSMVAEEIEKIEAFRESLRGANGEEPSEELLAFRTLNGPYRTNLDFYMAYLEAYLHADSRVYPRGSLLVRQLRPTPTGGLPIELYFFLNDTNWKNYETMQARMYTYFLAAAELFDLALHTVSDGSAETAVGGQPPV